VTAGEFEDTFGMPLRLNSGLEGDEFALVCGGSMVTHDNDGTITLYVRDEVGQDKWAELQRKWVPAPRLVPKATP
jgi:hypothetical protein